VKPGQDYLYPPAPSFFLVRWWLRRHIFRVRRRCPCCHAVGTFKAYDAVPTETDVPRRLHCKWCGFHERADGYHKTHPCKATGAWRLGDLCEECAYVTPQHALLIHPPEGLVDPTIPLANPWVG